MRASSPKRQLLVDVLIALVFLGVCAYELAHHLEDGPYLGSRWIAFAVDVPLCAALAVRRDRPRACLLVVNAVWLLASVVTWHTPLFLGNFVPMLLIAYTAARWTTGPWARWSWLTGVVFWLGMQLHAGDARHLVANPVLPVGIALVVWLIGTVLRRLSEQEQQLSSAYADLEREQAGRARRAAELERARIAGDMHDTVANEVSLMVVQVGSARMGLAAHGEQQADLCRAEQTGREALVELRRSLGVLRGTRHTSDRGGPLPLPVPAPERSWAPLSVVSTQVWDVLVALAFAAMAVLESVDLTIDDGVRAGSPTLNAVLGTAFCLPLALRRRTPRTTYTAMLLIAVVPAVFVGRSYFLYSCLMPLCVACFTLSRRDDGWLARTSWSGGLVLTLFAGLHTPHVAEPVNDVFSLVFTVAAWATGRTVRRFELQRDELRRTLSALAEEQADREDAAVEAERARIAAEMHDVVAHAVSTMVVQVGSARMHGDPDQDVEPLREAEETGRRALEELRTTLGLLRHDESDPELRPLPGLGGLDGLVGGFRSAGLDVVLTVTGSADLPQSAALTTYRLLQEALTNALKHGGPGRVEASVVVGDDRVRVRVTNPLGDGASRLPSGGHGLAGMRERVALFSGTLDAAPRDHRFVVEATLRLAREPVLT